MIRSKAILVLNSILFLSGTMTQAKKPTAHRIHSDQTFKGYNVQFCKDGSKVWIGDALYNCPDMSLIGTNSNKLNNTSDTNKSALNTQILFSPNGNRIIVFNRIFPNHSSSSNKSSSNSNTNSPQGSPTLPANRFSTDKSSSPSRGRTSNISNASNESSDKYSDSTMALYNTQTMALIGSTRGTDHATTFNPNGSQLLTADQSSCFIHDCSNMTLIDTLPKEKTTRFSPDGKIIISNPLSSNSPLVLYDSTTLKQIQTLPGYVVQFNPQGTILLAYQNDSSITMYKYSSRTKKLEFIKNIEKGPVVFSPNGTRVIIESTLYDIKHIKNMKSIHTFKNNGEKTNGTEFSPDGSKIVFQNKLYNMADLSTPIGTIKKGIVKFSPDGSKLGIRNVQEITFYNSADLKRLGSISGDEIYFSPDSSTIIASNSTPNTTTLYNSAHIKQSVTIEGISRSASISPDGKQLLTYKDGQTMIYQLT